MGVDISVLGAAATAPSSQFSSLLRLHRTRSGLTQRELADFSTISERAIRDLESGRVRQPRRDTVRLIADGLRLGPRARAELRLAADCARAQWPQAFELDDEPPGPPVAARPLAGGTRTAAALAGELAEGAERVVEIVGVTGVGKTRLAVEVAGRLHHGEEMPVLWFAFPGADADGYRRPTGPDGLAEAVKACVEDLFGPGPGSAREGREARDSRDGRDDRYERHDTRAAAEHDPARRRQDPDALVGALAADRPVLLVVDGAPGSARVERAARLLRHCPELRILVTAQRPTGLPGARTHTLHPLEVPEPGVEQDLHALARVPAVTLFLDETTRVHPGYSLTAADAADVAEICRLLDGVPAALRAAASWLLVYDTATLRRCLAEPSGLLGHLPGADDRWRIREGVERRMASLPGDARHVLAALCSADGDFDLAEAAGHAGLDVARCARVLRELLLTGLVRPASGATGRNRFRVLNLARALCPGGWTDSAAGVGRRQAVLVG